MSIRNEPLGTQLARELRRGILSGAREAGDLLIEKALSEQYGLSRGPVRDAFQQLKREGLIVPVGRSFRVAEFTGDDIAELYAVRAALETVAIERAIASTPDWSGAREAVRAMRVAAEQNDSVSFSTADLDFHRSFSRAVSQQRVVEATLTYEPTLQVLLELSPAVHEDLGSMLAEHEELLEAIETGDERWRDVLRVHLETGAQKLTAGFEQRRRTH